jgi:3-deoxy-D-manno-octulosonic-acid transferase
LIEPAILGKPILTGPKLNNVKDIADQFLSHQAIIIVKDQIDIAKSVYELSINEERYNEMINGAQRVIENNKGSTAKVIELIRPLIQSH